MSDAQLLVDNLSLVLDALEQIPRRFEGISQPADFRRGVEGRDRLDGICMSLITAGDTLKIIDRETKGAYLSNYPHISWSGVIGLRNVIAHGYHQIDVAQLFDVCEYQVPVLIETIKTMLAELQKQ